jgi:hypothetical protein
MDAWTRRARRLGCVMAIRWLFMAIQAFIDIWYIFGSLQGLAASSFVVCIGSPDTMKK